MVENYRATSNEDIGELLDNLSPDRKILEIELKVQRDRHNSAHLKVPQNTFSTSGASTHTRTSSGVIEKRRLQIDISICSAHVAVS